MRKIIVAILSVLFSFTLAGCSYNVTVNEDGTISATPEDGSSILNITPEGSSENPPMKPIEFTYGIPHQDAKDLLDPERDYLIVVNQENPFDLGGEYARRIQPDLVYFPNDVDGDIMACEKAAYLAYTSLKRDVLVNDGITIGLYDGFRTPADQEYLQKLYDEGAPGVTKTTEVGYTEHHTGLDLSLVIWCDENAEDDEDADWFSANEERLQTTPEFKTVYKKMVDYGFILRYPPEKADVTGHDKDETYEIRFVGSADVAREIMAADLCLEEYVTLKSLDEKNSSDKN